MSNQVQNPNSKHDLKARTSLFGAKIILLMKSVPDNTINRPLISQMIRSGTSIGANYMEADGAQSKKDFSHKIAISKKEAKESMHWLHMLAVANNNLKVQLRDLWKEAHELVLILSSIYLKSVKKK